MPTISGQMWHSAYIATREDPTLPTLTGSVSTTGERTQIGPSSSLVLRRSLINLRPWHVWEAITVRSRHSYLHLRVSGMILRKAFPSAALEAAERKPLDHAVPSYIWTINAKCHCSCKPLVGFSVWDCIHCRWLFSAKSIWTVFSSISLSSECIDAL